MLAISHWRKLKVRSFDRVGFAEAARALAEMSRGFNPTILIGIRTGGYHLGELMAPHLAGAILLAITCQRPSTGKKNAMPFIKHILSMLPRKLTDAMRIFEHIILTGRSGKETVMTIPKQELQSIEQTLKDHSPARILIIDDAVDSGATLSAVYQVILRVAATSDVIKIAAITVTTDAPKIEPDFSLYRYALCRFPWSLDSRA